MVEDVDALGGEVRPLAVAIDEGQFAVLDGRHVALIAHRVGSADFAGAASQVDQRAVLDHEGRDPGPGKVFVTVHADQVTIAAHLDDGGGAGDPREGGNGQPAIPLGEGDDRSIDGRSIAPGQAVVADRHVSEPGIGPGGPGHPTLVDDGVGLAGGIPDADQALAVIVDGDRHAYPAVEEVASPVLNGAGPAVIEEGPNVAGFVVRAHRCADDLPPVVDLGDQGRHAVGPVVVLPHAEVGQVEEPRGGRRSRQAGEGQAGEEEGRSGRAPRHGESFPRVGG